ncbi:Exonuclease SbcC [Pseudomonas sp. OF001]|nr:Exonuclease SbcC [Pseudomonas sp. OF001]
MRGASILSPPLVRRPLLPSIPGARLIPVNARPPRGVRMDARRTTTTHRAAPAQEARPSRPPAAARPGKGQPP